MCLVKKSKKILCNLCKLWMGLIGFCHFLSLCTIIGIQTLHLRMISQVFYHCATPAGKINFLIYFVKFGDLLFLFGLAVFQWKYKMNEMKNEITNEPKSGWPDWVIFHLLGYFWWLNMIFWKDEVAKEMATF